jgi:FkbM family methyltransferase
MVRQLFKKIWYGKVCCSLQKLFCRICKQLGLTIPIRYQHFFCIPGVFTVRLDGTTAFRMHNTGLAIERCLYWYGIKGYEPHTLSIFRSLMKQCDWMVDVGANTGLFSLTAAAIKPGANIMAFEPMPFFYNQLCGNIQLNDFKITPYELAVSDKEQVFDFYTPEQGQGNPYSSTLKKSHYDGHQKTEPLTIQVKATRLDGILEMHHLKGQGLMKIDAEGNDFEVLLGLGNRLETLNIYLIVENRSEPMAEKMMNLPGMGQYRFLSIPDREGEYPEWISLPVNNDGLNILFVPRHHVEFVNRILGEKFP